MAYCTKCGSELRDGDKFCYQCGAPVREESKDAADGVVKKDDGYNAGKNRKDDGYDAGKKFSSKQLAGGIAAAAVIIIVICFSLWGGRDRDADKDIMEDEIRYTAYSNDTVCFSLDYPEGYMVTEPEDNNVVITNDGDADFQVSAEYAFYTTTNSFIYSAKDFAEQIKDNEEVLTGWIGAPDIRITDTKTGRLGGRECYQYDFTLELKGNPNTGRLFLIDGDGEYGCYSLMTVINENAKDAKIFKKQQEAMENSFQVTGTHQADGYGIYHYDEQGVQFAVRDAYLGKTKESGSRIVVYPAEGVYSEASIWMGASNFDSDERDADAVLEKECKYILENKDNAKMISQPAEIEGGRYPMSGAALEFYDKGEKYTAKEIIVDCGKERWAVEMEASDEYLEGASAALSDILASLKFTDEEKTDSVPAAAGTAQDVIREIESQPGYTKSPYWEPLAASDDFNGDGTKELLAVYEMKDNSGINVMYDLWSLGKPEPQKLKSEVLFKEVGGNNGIAGIVNPEGEPLLAVYRYEPEGDLFHNYYTYFSWEKDKSALGDSGYYLECHGSYEKEEQGRYILGDTAVEKSKFDAKYKELTQWTYKLDLQGGAGGGVGTFDDMKLNP